MGWLRRLWHWIRPAPPAPQVRIYTYSIEPVMASEEELRRWRRVIASGSSAAGRELRADIKLRRAGEAFAEAVIDALKS